MPTALPFSTSPRMPLRQMARFGWLILRERHLARRMNRASRRQERIGVDRGGSRLLHFTRRWLACHAAMATVLDAPEPADVARVRSILDRRLPKFFSFFARKG